MAAEVAKVLLRHISQSGVPRIPMRRNGPALVSQVERDNECHEYKMDLVLSLETPVARERSSQTLKWTITKQRQEIQ